MAQFLVNIDLAGNEIQNFLVHKLGGPPTGVAAQMYYDTGVNKMFYKDNAGWRTVLNELTGVQSVGGTSPIASSGGTAPVISLGTVPATLGGTGLASPTTFGFLITQGASAMSVVVPTDGQILIGKTGYNPVAATLTQVANRTAITSAAGSITIDINATQFPSSGIVYGKALISDPAVANTAAWGTAPVSAGGTGLASVTLHSFLVGAGTSNMTEIGPLADGQVIIGKTGAAPLAATLTGTTKRLGVTSGGNSITLNIDTTQFPQAVIGDTGKPLVCSGADAAA